MDMQQNLAAFRGTGPERWAAKRHRRDLGDLPGRQELKARSFGAFFHCKSSLGPERAKRIQAGKPAHHAMGNFWWLAREHLYMFSALSLSHACATPCFARGLRVSVYTVPSKGYEEALDGRLRSLIRQARRGQMRPSRADAD